MTDSWDDEDRAIARALGAEIPDGDALTTDSEAVADYETALSAMPFDEVAPRAALEDDVIAAALARRPAAATAIDGHRTRRRNRSRSARWIAMGGAAAAAAAIAVVLAVSSLSTGSGEPGGRITPAASTVNVAQVLAESGTRTAVLRTDQGAVVGRLALSADGEGFVYELAPGAARWLWLESSGDQIPVGRFTGTTVHFVVRGDVSQITGVVVMPGPVLSDGPSRADAVFKSAN